LASQRAYWFQRAGLWRALAAVFIAVSVLAPAAIEAKTAVPRAYAGIVMDAKTGKVLYESDADAYRYPASISKVMTLYVLFQELSAGHIKLTTQMPVSKHAAAASPTKLGLKAGSTISVENAIKSLVTISANDMARVIAEYIGGSEENFAKRMTTTARALGMKHTTYVNASGLPDTRQITTVRDQAILAAAIAEHYPKYYTFFQTRSFQYGRRTYNSHVPLLGVAGVEGMKTGYINSSGYNLMTVTRKDDKHLVIIGFGFNSPKARDMKVASQLSKYLDDAHSGSYLKTALIPMPGRKGTMPVLAQDDEIHVASADPVVPMAAPAFRITDEAAADDSVAPADPQSGVGDVDDDLAVADVAPQPAPMPLDLGMPEAVTAVNKLAGALKARHYDSSAVDAYADSTMGAAPAPLGQTRPSAPLIPPVGIGTKGQPIDLMTSGSISGDVALQPRSDAAPQILPAADTVQVAEAAPEQAMPAPLPQGWVVQVGAAPTRDGANSLLDSAGQKVRALGKLQAFVVQFDKDGQTYFRARFGGFSGQSAANDMCKQLKQAKLSCLAMQS